MKRTILALALLVALVLPGMAKAEGTGMYLAPKFLMTIQETGTIERSGMGGVDEYSQFTLGGALAAGYDFWPQYLVPLRVELEYALRGNSEKSWGSNWGSVDCTWNSSPLFANLYYDFRNDSAFVPYIGAGIGMSFNYLGFDLHRGGSAVSRDESTTNFAWNVGAGVAYNVNDALYIDAAYRYVDLGYTEASGALNGDQIKVGSRPYNHEFMLGLRFAF